MESGVVDTNWAYMATARHRSKSWRDWTVEIKVWKILAVLIAAPILVFWFAVVHQKDEILALDRNEVVTDASGQRHWVGSFVNTNDRSLRDVGVTVDFLDSENRTVGKTAAMAVELSHCARLVLRAPLPPGSVRLRVYSVQWRMGHTTALMGPFREPWEFGYLMVDAGKSTR
jgi:hypothetical protein